MEQVWIDLKKKDELRNCKSCNKKIWKHWHTPVGKDPLGRTIYPIMEECAPCYFKHG